MTQDFIYCEIAEESFGKSKKTASYDGDVSISYLTDNKNPQLITGAREYQREKVASLSFKQGIMLTVILNSYKKIPEIHIRVCKRGKSFVFELVDGQQRVTSIIDFINGEFPLPNDKRFIIDGIDLRNKDIVWIRQNQPKLYQNILSYRISCVWYENLSNAQTADLFINVLNKTNPMNPQEKRNAIRGELSRFIRETARFDDKHDMFETIQIVSGKGKKKKNKYVLKHFSEGFKLSGHMEVDEFLSELICMRVNGYRNGLTQSNHTNWIELVQTSGDGHTKISTKEEFENFKESVIDPLLEFAFEVIKEAEDNKYKLAPMFSQILILYGYELKEKYGKLIISKYVDKFFEIYNKWSNTDTKVYSSEYMWGTEKTTKEQMEPFKKLFGGKNAKAIGTITYILDKELKADEDSFGVIEIDNRDFTKNEIIQKWEEQGKKCGYTKEPIDIKKIVGDHNIPRSWGMKKGGLTEYHNLVVTTKAHNLAKLNMSGDEYRKLLIVD